MHPWRSGVLLLLLVPPLLMLLPLLPRPQLLMRLLLLHYGPQHGSQHGAVEQPHVNRGLVRAPGHAREVHLVRAGVGTARPETTWANMAAE